jgi:clathrin heavy chain
MSAPITFHELFQLPALGITPQNINFSSVTLESDKFVCVRDTVSPQKTITIIETATQQITTNKVNADSAIMNPTAKILALRAGNTMQIFNLDQKQRLKQYTMNEAVIFWKWISATQIAIVTATAVYHWTLQGEEAPKQIFTRHQNLEGAQIINYRTDKKQQWLLLIGLAPNPDNTLRGVMQLYSVEKGVTQFIEGHAGCFIDFQLTPSYTTTLISIASNSAAGGKLFIMEVPSNKPDTVPPFQKKAVAVQFAQGDFPVAMQASDRHGVLYLITKLGFLYLYDCETGALLYKNRITTETVFATAPYEASNGVIAVNKLGQVLVVSVDDNTIVNAITAMGQPEIAFKLAARAKLSGADELYIAQFNNLLQTNQIEEAVKLAVEAPNGILRTPQTIQRLQRLAAVSPKPPLSIYFNYIIQTGSLNKYESVELANLVLQKPAGAEYIKKLLGEGKVEASEPLGDILRQFSPELAMQIYLKAGSHDRIIESLLQRGEYQKVLKYCEKVNFQPNYLDLFRKLVLINPDDAVKFAVELNEKPQTRLDPNVVVDVFIQASMIKQATAFLLEILKEDKPEDGPLQTRLLEINLRYSPVQVPDQILAQQMFSHYDKKIIAQLCEQVGLFQRALENYTDINDKKRVIVNTQYMDPNWLVGYFGTMSPEEGLLCLRELMKIGSRQQNLNIVVQVATKYSEELTPAALIQLFEDFRSPEGLFYYLGSIVDHTQDPDVIFKYIQAAFRIGNIAEIERVTRENDFYDPEKVKEFLKEFLKNQDQMPLINVCDKHNYIPEMVAFLYANNMLKYIDLYVKSRNPLKTPVVIGALLDVDSSEDYIRNLIMSVGSMCPIEPLVAEVEKRNRLKLLLPWLEARANEGSQEPALHNALAKIYIDLNNNAEQFLKTNQFYDPRVVGKYCEKRDPHLAFVAYKKGQCDLELVEVTVKNGMFKHLARYLVQRQNPELWAHVLGDEKSRRAVIDQVVQTALPETTNPEEVSATVKAFITADLPNELIELLEQIVLHGSSEFKKNKNLQNLLILTAIKADPTRVMDYINRLDNFDGADIARIAVDKKLYEEAFTIYQKFKLHTNAIRVLIENINNIKRAQDYADKVNDPEVWSLLGRAQLAAQLVTEAITSFLKASDPSAYHDVIVEAEKAEKYQDLIKFLRMARGKVQDSHIDTELCYAFAKFAKQNPQATGLTDLEDFISSPNIAQIQSVGDRCFEEGLYEAARILFSNINNYSKLASTYIKLGKNREAVNAATKANSIKTWKEVLFACVDSGDFKYAQACGLNIIIQADELDDLIHYYEARGHYEELLDLLEKGLGLERAHMGIFTSLGVLYAKYKPEKVMEHITRYYRRAHIPKLLHACEQNHLWAEMRFLYTHHEEFDNAIRVMIDHSADAWDHTIFTDTITKVVNMELYYKAIQFYLEEQPKYIIDLLHVLSSKLDNERVAREVKQAGYLPMIKEYLESVQDANLLQVNEALNQLYIEEEDYQALKASIELHNNFDHIALAKQLESHELLEFRRISASLYKTKKQYAASITLSKKDKLYKDAMETAAESEDQEIAEDLLKFFVDNKLQDCFAACLYTCYSLIRADVAMEYAWRFKMMDMAMPFLIQVVREYTSKVDDLYTRMKEQERAAKEKKEAPQEAVPAVTPVMDPSQAYGQMAYGMMDPSQAYAYGQNVFQY